MICSTKRLVKTQLLLISGLASLLEMKRLTVADPDLELGRGVGVACPAGFSSFCDLFFILPEIRGGGGPSPSSATGV